MRMNNIYSIFKTLLVKQNHRIIQDRIRLLYFIYDSFAKVIFHIIWTLLRSSEHFLDYLDIFKKILALFWFFCNFSYSQQLFGQHCWHADEVFQLCLFDLVMPMESWCIILTKVGCLSEKSERTSILHKGRHQKKLVKLRKVSR